MVFLTKVCFPQLSVVMLLVLSELKGRAENQTGLLQVLKAGSSHAALCALGLMYLNISIMVVSL